MSVCIYLYIDIYEIYKEVRARLCMCVCCAFLNSEIPFSAQLLWKALFSNSLSSPPASHCSKSSFSTSPPTPFTSPFCFVFVHFVCIFLYLFFFLCLVPSFWNKDTDGGLYVLETCGTGFYAGAFQQQSFRILPSFYPCWAYLYAFVLLSVSFRLFFFFFSWSRRNLGTELQQIENTRKLRWLEAS